MPVLAYLRRLLTTLHGWWQQELEELANAAPYPLDQDEWEFFQAQEEARLRLEQAATAKTKSYINERGCLVGIDAGGGAGQ